MLKFSIFFVQKIVTGCAGDTTLLYVLYISILGKVKILKKIAWGVVATPSSALASDFVHRIFHSEVRGTAGRELLIQAREFHPIAAA